MRYGFCDRPVWFRAGPIPIQGPTRWSRPNGPLTLVGGTLYGTTTGGGSECADVKGGCGTVYSIDANGNETVLYRFKGRPDGAEPSGNLVSLDGNLYGTTEGGGSGGGTVFVITPSGSERVLSGGTSRYGIDLPSGLVAMSTAYFTAPRLEVAKVGRAPFTQLRLVATYISCTAFIRTTCETAIGRREGSSR